VYICTGVISIGWREALDAFVTAFGMWCSISNVTPKVLVITTPYSVTRLVACFLFRFRSAIVAMSNDEDFEQGMVRATKVSFGFHTFIFLLTNTKHSAVGIARHLSYPQDIVNTLSHEVSVEIKILPKRRLKQFMDVGISWFSYCSLLECSVT
jgi:hypothetical protein